MVDDDTYSTYVHANIAWEAAWREMFLLRLVATSIGPFPTKLKTEEEGLEETRRSRRKK